MKREIPQKVDAKFGLADQVYSASVARFCATLFRRTRSASLLSFTLTAGTLGVLLPHQKAQAFPTLTPTSLGSVPSLPHLFNSADTSSESYQSFDYLGTQKSIAVLQTNTNQDVASNIIFQPNEVLSARLQLNTLPQELGASPSTQNSAPTLAAELKNANGSGAIATSVKTPENSANASSTSLTVEESGTFVHRVEVGENLTAIADKYQVSPEAIAQTNQILNPNVIEVHEDLVIPAPSLSAVVATPLMLGTLVNDTKAILNEADYQETAAKVLKPERLLSQPASAPYVQATRRPNLEIPQIESSQIESSQIRSPQIGLSLSEGVQVAKAAEPFVQPSTSLAFHQSRQQRRQSSAPLLEITSPLAATSTVVARRAAFPLVPSLDLPSLVSADQFLPSTLQGSGSLKYIWPARGVFTSGYGWRWGRMHRGIDISAPVGTPVVSSAPGVVVTAGWNDGGYGNLVEVKHSDGSLTVYAHNSRIVTRVGAVVNQGELIAQMGSTGRSTGPHTHFEIRPHGSGAVNPMSLLARS